MKNTLAWRLSQTLLIVFLSLIHVTWAEDLSLQEKGFNIAARSDRSDRGFGDSVVELKMVLRNANGLESIRLLSLKTLEIESEELGDKSLIIFDSPSDIKGTALLSYAKILDPDDQWLFLPALKRVKRISSVNKSGPFVGSEFAFEDFTSLELNKYQYKYVGEETCDEFICDVIERVPRYRHSGYTRQVAFIDKSVYQMRKLEFYDRGNAHLKSLKFKEYRQYDNGVWRAHLLYMVNHLKGKSTDLIYSNYQFSTGLKDKDFQKGILARLR